MDLSLTEIAAIVGIAVGLVTLIKEWGVISSAIRKITTKVWRISIAKPSRRKFLITAVAGSVLTVTFFAFPNLRNKIEIELTSKDKKITKNVLLKNKMTGVIHHVGACSDHLPKDAEQIEIPEQLNVETIHKSKQQHIASIILSGITDSKAEELLVAVITKNPTSTHLYKYLIGYWGREKMYDKIHEFLEANISYLNSKLRVNAGNPKLLKKYAKAISELEQRQDRARYLSRVAKIL